MDELIKKNYDTLINNLNITPELYKKLLYSRIIKLQSREVLKMMTILIETKSFIEQNKYLLYLLNNRPNIREVNQEFINLLKKSNKNILKLIKF